MMGQGKEFEQARAAAQASTERYSVFSRMTPNQRNRVVQYEAAHGVTLSAQEIEKRFIPHGVFRRGRFWP